MNESIDVIVKGIGYLFASFAVAAVFAPVVIGLLYKLHFTVRHVVNKDNGNKDFVKIHGWKTGTPTMGGIIIWLIVPLLSWTYLPHIPVVNVFILGFLGVGLFGFLDDFLTMMTKFNNSLRQIHNYFGFRLAKLALMWGISFVVAWAFTYSVGMSEWILPILGQINLSPLLIILCFTFFMPFVIYCFDIYDGADGLSSGTFIANLSGLTLLLLLQGQFNFVYICMMLIGVLIVFLYFNIPPARVWMGAPGAMAIGFAFYYIAIVTDNLLPVIIMTMVQWIDFASSIIQIFSLKFLKRKIFKIAPLHHLFEAVGWPEYKVVMRFWLTALVFTLVGLYVGLAF